MRKFNLYFDLGGAIPQKYTLNGENNAWFTNPSGLGVDYSPAMVDLRNGFFKPITTDIIPQTPIVGDITFMRNKNPVVDAYAGYRGFVNYIERAKKIEFAYQPFGTDEYRCEVKVDYITKTEKSGNWLTCPISFMPLTPWYQAIDVEVTLDGDEGGGAFLKQITPLGDVPAAIELTLTGGGTPMLISAATVGEALGSIALESAQLIKKSGVVVYSTKYNDSFATFTADDDGTITDLVSLDGMPNVFARLKPFAENYILVVYDAGTPLPTQTKLKLYYYYRSV